MEPITPLRRADEPRVRAQPGFTADAELVGRLLEVLGSTTDHASWSDELATSIRTPVEERHLSPLRPNVLRGLNLPTGGSVLEIGAGSGALTRYLGENAAIVDALETDPGLADLAAHRCADLPAVQVHRGDLDDVPAEPAYDLIVALELDGTADIGDVLARCRAILRPGGLIVVAAAPASAETEGMQALSATRTELLHAAQQDGFSGRVLGAFPDHRLTTALIDHAELRRVAAPLLIELVRPPKRSSADESTGQSSTSDAWAQHVVDGDDSDHPGSFVLVVGKNIPEPDPAVFWSSGRRAEVSACNRVRATADGCMIVRERAIPAAPAPEGPLALVPHVEPYVPGTSLTRLLAHADSLADAASYLRAWRTLVKETVAADGTVPWDLIPRNVQVAADGSLHAIDQEWSREGAGTSMVLHRGAFWLSHDLILGPTTPWWLTGHTITSGADVLTALAGEPVTVDWRPAMIDSESVSMGWVNPLRPLDSVTTRIKKEWQNVSQLGKEPHDLGDVQPPEHDSPETTTTLQHLVSALSVANGELRARVEKLELARREDDIANRDHAIGLRAKIESLRAETNRAKSQAAHDRQAAQAALVELEAVRKSTTWRLGSAIVGPLSGIRKRAGR